LDCLKLTYSKYFDEYNSSLLLCKDGSKEHEVKSQKRIKVYSFGFNGKEVDDEVSGSGNSYDFGARLYNPRLGRWLALDPKAYRYTGYSPYHFGYDNPIVTIDPDGNQNIVVVGGQPRDHSPTSDVTNPQNRYGKDGLYRRHFLEAGLNEAIAMKENSTENGETTKMLVFNQGYTKAEIDYYTQKAMANGIDIEFYSDKESMVDYINKKDGGRGDDAITSFGGVPFITFARKKRGTKVNHIVFSRACRP
jgi:RHS repeat-associated protein